MRNVKAQSFSLITIALLSGVLGVANAKPLSDLENQKLLTPGKIEAAESNITDDEIERDIVFGKIEAAEIDMNLQKTKAKALSQMDLMISQILKMQATVSQCTEQEELSSPINDTLRTALEIRSRAAQSSDLKFIVTADKEIIYNRNFAHDWISNNSEALEDCSR